MRKKIKAIIVVIILAIPLAAFYIMIPPRADKIHYGIVFSQKHARDMGLDWKETYLALLSDLKVKNIKLAAHWDLLEPNKGQYDFSELDWQMEQARSSDAKVMLAIGMKTPRWPECHIPEWAKGIGKDEQQARILEMIKVTVNRYKDAPELIAWQVENEPLFRFGDCPWLDKKFLAREAAFVRELDGGKHRIVISDSGEGSWWFDVAKIGDVAGITMYRSVYFNELKQYVSYPIPPLFYWIKSKIVYGLLKKPVICVELQAEPWCAGQIYNCSAAEESKTMTIAPFRQNIDFGKKTGFDTFYLWGAEWWYRQKTVHNDPSYWEEAKKLWQ